MSTAKLVFEADTSEAVDAFGDVGKAGKKMTDDLDDASSGFGRAGEAADHAEGKAIGFKDTLTGLADTGAGVGQIMKGNLFEGVTTAAQGIADLAGGMATFLIPMLEKTRLGTLAKAAADRIVAAGTKVWAGVQWLMNTALLASPITWIVLGIVALIAVIILIAKHSKWFADVWKQVWAAIKLAASAVWDWIKTLPQRLRDVFAPVGQWIADAFTRGWTLIKTGFSDAWAWIKKTMSTAWDWLMGLPGKLKPAFNAVVQIITGPFRMAFNAVADLWNASLGKIKLNIPSWVPGVGGKTWSFPTMQHVHAGGIIGGVVGTAVPVLAMAGERVSSVASSGGQGFTLGSDGSRLGDLLVELIANTVRGQGGDPAVLGIQTAPSR